MNLNLQIRRAVTSQAVAAKIRVALAVTSLPRALVAINPKVLAVISLPVVTAVISLPVVISLLRAPAVTRSPVVAAKIKVAPAATKKAKAEAEIRSE